MSLLRVRLGAFLSGFALAAGASVLLLQRDLWASHRALAHAAETGTSSVTARLDRLERVTAELASRASDRPTTDANTGAHSDAPASIL
eukprot:SM000468S16947  [mRNA]  locus=s468:11731:12107:- [translate_table: standard]